MILFEVRDMRPLKVKVSLTLDEDIAEKIRTAAENDDRSFSQYINLVLREHLRTLEKKAPDNNE